MFYEKWNRRIFRRWNWRLHVGIIIYNIYIGETSIRIPSKYFTDWNRKRLIYRIGKLVGTKEMLVEIYRDF
jgi:hypothetical protein